MSTEKIVEVEENNNITATLTASGKTKGGSAATMYEPTFTYGTLPLGVSADVASGTPLQDGQTATITFTIAPTTDAPATAEGTTYNITFTAKRGSGSSYSITSLTATLKIKNENGLWDAELTWS